MKGAEFDFEEGKLHFTERNTTATHTHTHTLTHSHTHTYAYTHTLTPFNKTQPTQNQESQLMASTLWCHTHTDEQEAPASLYRLSRLITPPGRDEHRCPQ